MVADMKTGRTEKEGNEKQKNLNMKNLGFDDLLPYAGEFGRYQVYLFCLTMPFYFYGVIVYFTQIFLTEVSPEYWCWIPELANLTAAERKELAIPKDVKSRHGYSQCSMYASNWSQFATGQPNLNSEIIPCQNGWEFSNDIPYPTITSDLGWVCDKDSYKATAQCIFFAGSIAGGFVIGWISDRYGRLPGLVIANLVGAIGGLVTIFARNLLEFSLYRFITGFAYDNCMMVMYLLLLEYIAPKYRTLAANMAFAIFFAFGAVLLPWIALACGHWKTLAIATSSPILLALLAPFFVPESPKWLLTKGRVDDAVSKLLVIGRINKKKIPDDLIQSFKVSATLKSEVRDSKKELLKRPLMRRLFVLICVEYICCALVFDVLVRSVGLLGFDFFISFTFVSMTECPSLMLVAFVMDWMGRRWLMFVCMSISCVFSLFTAFVGGGIPSVACAVVARFAMNMCYNTAIQWAAEMLPTGVRASGTSIVHIFGYIGSITTPYIVYLDVIEPWLPLVVAACVSVLGALIALTLPETAGKPMPQTFDEAERLARHQNFWEMPCLSRKKQETSVSP